MNERVAPFYCPYCGDEDLRPNAAGHGAWECRSCVRVFSVTFVGMLAVQGQAARIGTTPAGRDREETR